MIGEKAADLILEPLNERTDDRTTLTRPASITDELLERITARVVSTGGGVWKLTEVYTGEVLVGPPAVDARPTSRPPSSVPGRRRRPGRSGR